jgi:hypothetical protein
MRFWYLLWCKKCCAHFANVYLCNCPVKCLTVYKGVLFVNSFLAITKEHICLSFCVIFCL